MNRVLPLVLLVWASIFLRGQEEWPQVLSEGEAREVFLEMLVSGTVPMHLAHQVRVRIPAEGMDRWLQKACVWTERTLNDEDFRKTYLAWRQEHRPGAGQAGPRDAAGLLAEQNRSMEEQIRHMQARMKTLGPELRTQLEEQIRQMRQAMEEMRQNSEALAAMDRALADQEQQRTSAVREEQMRFDRDFPEEVRDLARRRLNAFLELSRTVRWEAPTEQRNGLLRFSREEDERRPAEWKLCYRVGRGLMGVARERALMLLERLGGAEKGHAE